MENFKPKKLDKSNIIFLSFEGIEGCGKSTQIQLVSEFLTKNTEYTIHHFREPGGTEFGESLRNAMLGAKDKVSPLSEAHLFAASRCQLLTERVLPLSTSTKNIVIYDRYIHSSIAYQGFGSELGVDTVLDIHSHYPLNILPHLTIYLEIDQMTSLERQEKRNNKKDYFESKENEFYKKVINGFMWCKNNLENFLTIDGTMNKEHVKNEIIKSVTRLLHES